MIVSVTEIRLKNAFCLPKFLYFAIWCLIISYKTEGHLSTLSRSGILRHRTLSTWENREAMMRFVRSKAHTLATKTNPEIAKSSFVCHYEAQRKPSWKEAIHYLKMNGRPS